MSAPTRFICTFLPVALMAAPRRRRTVAIVSPGDNVIRPAWSGPRRWTMLDILPDDLRALPGIGPCHCLLAGDEFEFWHCLAPLLPALRALYSPRPPWPERTTWELGPVPHGPLCEQAHRPCCYACGRQAGNCTPQIVQRSKPRNDTKVANCSTTGLPLLSAALREWRTELMSLAYSSVDQRHPALARPGLRA